MPGTGRTAWVISTPFAPCLALHSRLGGGETAVSLQKMADSRQIQLSINITEPLPILRMDRKRMGEALHHLMHNALKFTPENGRVTVKCRQKNEHLVVQVQDNGIGIPEDKLAEIWEPFGQESGRVRRGVEGLGLGLPLVKTIIQAHRGRVGATSEPGKGSNFYFALPLNLTSTE